MNVTTMKEAILISLEKYGYDINNKKIMKKIINSALMGDAKYFTRHNGARDFILGQGKENILKELRGYSDSNDLNVLIDTYIENMFKKQEFEADLKRVFKVIKSLNLNIENDEELREASWNYFINVFQNNNKSFSCDELKKDMIKAALEVSKEDDFNQSLVLDEKKLTMEDSIYLVKKYVNENKLDSLLKMIETNAYLSRNLLTNMLNYVYFEQEKNLIKS